MSGLAQILETALARKLRFVTLNPEGAREDHPRTDACGSFVLVNDDPDTERDASLGPDHFRENLLAGYMNGSQVIVASAVLDDSHCALLSALVAIHPVPWFVLVTTQPQHHGAWTRKITQLTGQAPLIHIVTEDSTPDDWGAPAVEAPSRIGEGSN